MYGETVIHAKYLHERKLTSSKIHAIVNLK